MSDSEVRFNILLDAFAIFLPLSLLKVPRKSYARNSNSSSLMYSCTFSDFSCFTYYRFIIFHSLEKLYAGAFAVRSIVRIALWLIINCIDIFGKSSLPVSGVSRVSCQRKVSSVHDRILRIIFLITA